MNNSAFSVLYNGHPVAVSVLPDDSYVAQVSYKPLRIQLKKNNDGTESWVDSETQQTTFVSNEIGKLIADHLYSVEQV